MADIIKSEGIIFRNLKYSESSVIMDIYSVDHGLVSCIVSGVRKARSKMANVFHPLNIIDFVAYEKEGGLSRIKEAQYAFQYKHMYTDVFRSTVGMFVIDLARNAIREKEANASAYRLIRNYLTTIDAGEIPLKHLAIRFSLELAEHLGFQIMNNYGEEHIYFDLGAGAFTDRPGGQYFLDEDLSNLLWQYLEGHQVPRAGRQLRNDLLDKIVLFYRLHVDGFKGLKSLDVVRAILS